MKFTVIAMLPVALISLVDIYAQLTATDLNSYWAARIILGPIGGLFLFAWVVTCLALAARSRLKWNDIEKVARRIHNGPHR